MLPFKVATQLVLYSLVYAPLAVGFVKIGCFAWHAVGGGTLPVPGQWLESYGLYSGLGHIVLFFPAVRVLRTFEEKFGLNPGDPRSIPLPSTTFPPQPAETGTAAVRDVPFGKITGRVVSWVADRGYGFISGVDGESYFFRQEDLVERNALDVIHTDVEVMFDTKATPKGNRAIRVVTSMEPDAARYELPGEVILSKISAAKGYAVIENTRWNVTGESRDMNEARMDLVQRAKLLGASAVLNMTYSKRTESESSNSGQGTHYYTVHRYSGDLAVAAKLSFQGGYQRSDLFGLDRSIQSFKDACHAHNQRAGPIIWWQVVLLCFGLAGSLYLTSGVLWYAQVGVTYILYRLASPSLADHDWVELRG